MQKRVTLYELKTSEITVSDPRYVNVQSMEPMTHIMNTHEVAMGLSVNTLRVPIEKYCQVENGYRFVWYVAMHPDLRKVFHIEINKYKDMELALDNYKNASFLTKLRRLFT